MNVSHPTSPPPARYQDGYGSASSDDYTSDESDGADEKGGDLDFTMSSVAASHRQDESEEDENDDDPSRISYDSAYGSLESQSSLRFSTSSSLPPVDKSQGNTFDRLMMLRRFYEGQRGPGGEVRESMEAKARVLGSGEVLGSVEVMRVGEEARGSREVDGGDKGRGSSDIMRHR